MPGKTENEQSIYFGGFLKNERNTGDISLFFWQPFGDFSFFLHMNTGNIAVVLGAQWGDEGKGKLVDALSKSHSVIVRAGGGANAGHTIYRQGQKYVFHLLPSGLIEPENIGIIGNGCVVHLPSLLHEIHELSEKGISVRNRIFLSTRAHLLFDFHQEIDSIQEERKGKECVGTTKRGIGPAYTDKVSRSGIRAGELVADFKTFAHRLREHAEEIKIQYGISIDIESLIVEYQDLAEEFSDIVRDTEEMLEQYQQEGKNILVEGAQGFMLDIDHGTYPFVTSSHTTVSGASQGTGIAPNRFTEIIGVAKAYVTRVGSGPLVSELLNETGETLRKIGHEYGATTGRPRRCGWIDVVALKKFVRVNGANVWNLTKLDVLADFDHIGVVVAYDLEGEHTQCIPADIGTLAKVKPVIQEFSGWKKDISKIRTFEDLPVEAKNFIEFLEKETGIPVKYIGVGMESEALIIRDVKKKDF